MSEQSTRDRSRNEGWQACVPGTLKRLAARHQARQRQSRMAALAGLVAAGCLLIATAYWNWGQPAPSGIVPVVAGDSSDVGAEEVRSLGCHQILAAVDIYLTGAAEVTLRSKIRSHLDHCPRCVEFYQRRALELGVDFAHLSLPSSDLTSTLATLP